MAGAIPRDPKSPPVSCCEPHRDHDRSVELRLDTMGRRNAFCRWNLGVVSPRDTAVCGILRECGFLVENSASPFADPALVSQGCSADR